MKAAIIIPVYNEEVFLENFYNQLYANLIAPDSFNFYFIDDGSTDYSSGILKRIANKNSNVKVVTLDKNYGKQIAIAAGLKIVTEQCVLITSINPYNPWIAINEAVKKWEQGYKIVRAQRANYKESAFKKFKNGLFKRATKIFGINDEILSGATIELYDKDVVDVINSIEEKSKFLRSINCWVGFKIYSFYYNTGKMDIVSGKQYKAKKEEYNLLREKNNIQTVKKDKVRFYKPSLYISVSMLALFAVLVFVAVIVETYVGLTTMGALFFILAIICSLFTGILMALRAWFIKRLGYVLSAQRGKQIYKITEIYGNL